MGWTCRMREEPTRADLREGRVEVGEMWFARWLVTEEGVPAVDNYLSTTYIANRMGVRPPLMILLPGNVEFCLDGRADCNGGEVGWELKGELPKLTANPSLNVLGTWHGFLRDGVLSDDLSGRSYG